MFTREFTASDYHQHLVSTPFSKRAITPDPAVVVPMIDRGLAMLVEEINSSRKSFGVTDWQPIVDGDSYILVVEGKIATLRFSWVDVDVQDEDESIWLRSGLSLSAHDRNASDRAFYKTSQYLKARDPVTLFAEAQERLRKEKVHHLADTVRRFYRL